MIVDEQAADPINQDNSDIEMQFSESVEYSPKQFVLDFERRIDMDFKQAQEANFKVLNCVKNEIIG